MIITGIDIDDGVNWYNSGRRMTATSLTFLRNLAIATECGESRIEAKKLARQAKIHPDVVFGWDWYLEGLVRSYTGRNARGHWIEYVAITTVGQRYLKARGEWPEILDAAAGIKAKPTRRRA